MATPTSARTADWTTPRRTTILSWKTLRDPKEGEKYNIRTKDESMDADDGTKNQNIT
jgi:hypothetical protein